MYCIILNSFESHKYIWGYKGNEIMCNKYTHHLGKHSYQIFYLQSRKTKDKLIQKKKAIILIHQNCIILFIFIRIVSKDQNGLLAPSSIRHKHVQIHWYKYRLLHCFITHTGMDRCGSVNWKTFTKFSKCTFL